LGDEPATPTGGPFRALLSEVSHHGATSRWDAVKIMIDRRAGLAPGRIG
jgi:hypothetical protein